MQLFKGGAPLSRKSDHLRHATSSEVQLQLHAEWEAAEEMRVATKPAPPLWDDNVAPEHADSLLITDARYTA